MLAKGTFDRKRVFITGAGTGIGRDFALRVAELGGTPILAGRREELLQKVADEIAEAGGRAVVCPMDIRDPDLVSRQMDNVIAKEGGIDVLINNAAGNFLARAEDISPNGWNTIVNIVLNGTAYCTLKAGNPDGGRRQFRRQGRICVLV
ncbi:SDR family NAD(P)-dependent oxidoreductase [Roseovarius atlanticus]|uniref:SDR family NAD(P)-dependent oxidoreductase n=1 Tax=Roseovarius atlanticus TaxID=1641875 RepID=UPI0009EBC534|nr:SDR family NAD(P)-dependent oxidoreductase [Roseovarius atlanticus]